MGAAASSVEFPEGETGLGDLPESCAAEVLLHLDPRDICRLARLSRAFRAAAAGDPVWEAKLPANYRRLMTAAVGKITDLPLGKKQIYASLTSPNPFDGGNKEFWLEKSKGGFCMSISWKALSITAIDDRRHWTCIPTEESSSSMTKNRSISTLGPSTIVIFNLRVTREESISHAACKTVTINSSS